MKKTPLALSLVLAATHANAMNKCTDKDGNITFTDKPCASAQTSESVVVKNPINTMKWKPVDPIIVPQISGQKTRQRTRLIAGRCDGVSELTLRNARVSDTLMKCMTKKDVIAILGKPHYAHSSWSSTQWSYHFDANNAQGYHIKYVYFDLKDGLVDSWSGSARMFKK